ncbi:MAG: arylsulfatase A [Verrucomicrobiales bacterium]|jgi:arylsulfatase A
MLAAKSLILFAALSLVPFNWSQAQERPNFVVIMADDLGYGDIGCYGHPSIRTPHLDRMAKEGMRFTDFHSNGAVCSPTRAALMTGRYQQRTGVQGVITAANHRETGMPLEELTFAEALQTVGYKTGMYGKWHLGYPATFNPTHQGFDDFSGFVSGNIDYHSHVDQAMHLDWWQQAKIDDEPGYLTDLVSDKGVDFINRHKESPFCLYLAHGAPHYPYQGRKDPAFRTANGKRSKENVGDFDRRYKEMIEVMDEGIGRILTTLEQAGIDDRTLVIFMSDNGASAKAIKGIGSVGNLRGTKGSLWEGGTRVPCIVRWPGKIPSGTTSDELCLSMDWFPTLMELGQIEFDASPRIDGVSLVPVLTGKKALDPRTVFWQTSKAAAVRKGSLKWIVNGQKKQLFDLVDDLSEQSDIAAQNSAAVMEMERALETWRKDVRTGVDMISQ